MEKKIHPTFKSSLKTFFKKFRWIYFLGWLGLICLFAVASTNDLSNSSTSAEICKPMIVWIILPLLFATLRSLSYTLIFTNEELMAENHPNSLFASILSIKYSQINNINITTVPKKIAINYQNSDNNTRTITIYPDNYNATISELLQCFPTNIPVIYDKD